MFPNGQGVTVGSTSASLPLRVGQTNLNLIATQPGQHQGHTENHSFWFCVIFQVTRNWWLGLVLWEFEPLVLVEATVEGSSENRSRLLNNKNRRRGPKSDHPDFYRICHRERGGLLCSGWIDPGFQSSRSPFPILHLANRRGGPLGDLDKPI